MQHIKIFANSSIRLELFAIDLFPILIALAVVIFLHSKATFGIDSNLALQWFRQINVFRCFGFNQAVVVAGLEKAEIRINSMMGISFATTAPEIITFFFWEEIDN